MLDKFGHPPGFTTLSIGDPAPDFALPDIDGRTHTLADFAGADVLMVLFTSNHCPTSHAIERRLQALRAVLKGRSFVLVAINPNHPDGYTVDELGYSEYTDSFTDMKPYANGLGWDFPYLYDGDSQATARAYGSLCTPHVFVFNRERRLSYAGRFDDSRFVEEHTVKSADARNAIEDLLAGRPVAVPLTKPHGCSTKWREKRLATAAVAAAWKELPVTIEAIDAAGVAALRANPTDKYRLINVWATWCAPCVEEFPVLVSLSRHFDRRKFELVTISMDTPKEDAKVQKFLQRQGAGLSARVRPGVLKEGRTTNHYLYSGGSQDPLIAALDSEWPGSLPYSVLVAPGGKIIWRSSGVVNELTARTVIVEAVSRFR